MMADLRRRAEQVQPTRIGFAFEACSFGFRLHDELTAKEIEASLLAPTQN